MDSLTGVYNRKGLFDAIIPMSHLAQRNNFPIAIMMVDIDHFKKINDSFGHQVGDDVLAGVAKSLRNSIRTSDIVGRYGGEEFLLFFSPVELKSLGKMAKGLHHIIEEECSNGVCVTASIGVASGYIEGGDVISELQSLIKRADDNLYKAKQTGRNRVVVE